jgi:hypothetical protein
MQRVNNTFTQKGYKLSDIHYQDILEQIQNNILTIVLKVEVNSSLYSFQYKGPVNRFNSSITTSGTTANAAQVTVSGTTTTTATTAGASSPSVPQSVLTNQNQKNINTFVYGGINYQIAPSALSSQAYINLYLKYLQASQIIYSMSNLVGVYVNPLVQGSLLFRYKNNTQ